MSSTGDLSPGLGFTPEETRKFMEELIEVTPKLSRKGRRLALPAVSGPLLKYTADRSGKDAATAARALA